MPKNISIVKENKTPAENPGSQPSRLERVVKKKERREKLKQGLFKDACICDITLGQQVLFLLRDEFSFTPQELGSVMSLLCSEMGLHRPFVFQILVTLNERGLIEFVRTGCSPSVRVVDPLVKKKEVSE